MDLWVFSPFDGEPLTRVIAADILPYKTDLRYFQAWKLKSKTRTIDNLICVYLRMTSFPCLSRNKWVSFNVQAKNKYIFALFPEQRMK